jgi:cytochrome d ubiquinol oxidase subunit II
MHGSLYLLLKTEDKLFDRVRALNWRALYFFYAAMALATVMLFAHHLEVVERLWSRPAFLGFAVLAFVLSLAVPWLVDGRRYGRAFFVSALMIASLLALVFAQQFPLLIPSTLDPDGGMTLEEAASSPKTLKLLLTITAIGTPLVLLYFAFVYRVFKGPVKLDDMSY